tara:strand:- start:1563 stop:10430 length:8868 start_codon:yes stop_codon:yes gene_type:complete
MSNIDFYFKVKPKKDVKVTSMASVALPLTDFEKVGNWSHGFGIPYQQSEPKGYFDKNINDYGGDISKALLATLGINQSNISYKADESYDKESNKILRRGLTAEKIYQDQYSAPVSLFAAYKSWDSTKLTNFILESLVGKALTSALLYNYFGYPVSNIGRTQGRSGFAANGQDQEVPWAYPPGSQTQYYTNPQSIGFTPLLSPSSDPSINVPSFGSTGLQVGEEEYGSLHDLNGLFPEDERAQNVDLRLRITLRLAGSFGEENTFATVHTNSKTYPIGPSNMYINYEGLFSSPDYPWDWIPPLVANSELILGGPDDQYDAVDQKLTPTHAKMFMPSLESSVYPSLGNIMGSEDGIFNSKWFHDHKEEGEPSSFKYANLVSALKLVPPGIDESEVQEYLANPHKTLNEVIKNVFKFVAHVVPENIRYAGPKPTIKEPGTDSVTGENKPEACEDLLAASQLQINRVVSGSFFEINSVPPVLNVSTKEDRNFLGARDPDDYNDYPSDAYYDILNNVLWGKGVSSLFRYNRPFYYGKDPTRYIYDLSTKIDGDIKEYTYKFGLPPTSYIGTMRPRTPLNNDYNLRSHPFTIIPRNKVCIKTIWDSLPEYVRRLFFNKIGANEEFDFFENNSALDFNDPLDFTRFVTNLWISYHFASMPNSLYGQGWPITSPMEAIGFKINIKGAVYDQNNFNQPVETTPMHSQGIYADKFPLILNSIPLDRSVFSYLRTSNMNMSAASKGSYSDILDSGKPQDHFINAFVEFFGELKDVGYNASATGTLYSVENLLAGGQSDHVTFAAKHQVPYNITHKSPMIFPVWDYTNGGVGDSDVGNLSKIKWPKLINSQNAAGYDYTQEGSPWIPYLEQNPLLEQKERKCIPDWCTRLQIYPTATKEPLTYGIMNPNPSFKIARVYGGGPNCYTAGSTDFFGNETDCLKVDNVYLADNSVDNFVVPSEYAKNYKDEDLTLYQKARPYIVLDYEYDTQIATGAELYESIPNLGTKDKILIQQPGDYREGFGSSETYREQAHGAAWLTYAVDLEIDETKLIIDMVRHGVFALAGDFDEYQEAGIDPYDVFRAVGLNGQGAFYSQSLLSSYDVYRDTLEGTLQGVDFSQIPSFLKGDDVSDDMIIAVEQNLPIINEKYEDLVNASPIPDPAAATSYILVDQGQKTEVTAKATLRVQPGKNADSIGFIPNFTVVKVLKEWVNGEGVYNLIRIVDPDSDLNGLEGYIEIDDIVSIKNNIFFSDIFGGDSKGNLELAKLDDLHAIKQLTEGQKALIPTWWRNEVPYYHREDGEWWYAVELEDTCVLSDVDMEEKKLQALKKGVAELFYFLNREITDEQLETFVQTYLACKVGRLPYIDIRPNENAKFLIKVGAIYLHAFPSSYKSLEALKSEADKILTIDTRYYIGHLVQAGYGLNQMYLDILSSDFRVQGVNFALEAERLDRIPVLFKKLLSFNGYVLNSEEQNLINIGFDSEFNITFISYNEGTKEGNEKLLNIGFEYIKKEEPFNVKNTMSLFYHHRQLKNPLLKWQQAIKEIFLDPKPEIIAKEASTIPDIPSSRCKPPRFQFPSWQELLGPIAGQLDDALQLDPRFDLGSFQFSLTDYLPPCPKPPTGKGGILFRGEVETDAERLFFDSFESLTSMKDLQTGYKEYVGDFMTSAEGLRSIGDKAIDLDSLYNEVLRRVGGLETIYNKICRCFLDLAGLDTIEVPNFKVDLQGPSAGLNIKPLSYIPSLDPQAPAEQSITGGQKAGWNKGDEYEYDTGSFGSMEAFKDSFSTKPTVFDAGDLICSFCFEVPDFFLRLPTTNILDFLIQALLAALEFILAQILVELFATLLELLLRCPELTCPEGVKRVSDYGAQDLNQVMASDIGDSPAVFESCGVVVENTNDIVDLLDDISKILSSGEVLELFDGTSSLGLMKIIQKNVNKYPVIASQLDNTAKIRDFFRCVGFKIPPQKLAKIEDEIISKYQDPEVCENIFQEAKNQLQSKCGDLDFKDDIVKAATEVDIDNYINLANLIRKIPDLTQQIPPLFSDDKGNKGILSGLPNPTMDDAIEQTLQNMLVTVDSSLKSESKNFNNPNRNIMIKVDSNRKLLTSASPFGSFFYAPLNPLTFAAGAGLWPAFIYGGGGTQLADNDLWSYWFPIADKMAPYTSAYVESSVLADGTLEYNQFSEDSNYLKGIDDILREFSTDLTQYISITSGNSVIMNIPLPEFYDNGVQTIMSFSPPEKDENDNLIYTNNISVVFKTPQIIEGTYSLLNENPEAKVVSDSILPILNKYPLQDTGVPPQNQYFASLMADKIMPSSDISVEKKQKFLDETYDIFSGDLYNTIFSSILAGIAETVGNSETLTDYEIDLFDDLLENFPMGSGIIFILKGLWDAVGIDIKARTTKKEMEFFDLTPNKSFQGFSQGLIDLQRVYDVTRENYDFSNYSDPNSNELGMPQFAMLEGITSAYIQMVIAEAVVRGIPTISKFPKYLITQGKMFPELVLKMLNKMLEEDSMRDDFGYICKTLLTRRSEFRFKDPKKTAPGNSGVIMEKRTGTEIEINTNDDAIRFYIRENMEYPLNFIFSRLGIFKGSGQNFTNISQVNPLDLIAYNAPVWVHDESHQTGFDKPPENLNENPDIYDFPSSFFTNQRYKSFLNGKFVNQVYYEVEDWASEQEAIENGGVWLSYLQNRENKLKKVLSQDNLFKLINLLDVWVGTNEFNHLADEPFIKFFKSIKLGTRLCYVFIRSEKIVDGASSGIAGFEDIEEDVMPYADGQLPTLKDVSQAIDEALGIKPGTPDDLITTFGPWWNLVDEDFKEYIDLNKSILIIEGDVFLEDSITTNNPPAKTYIFPVIESSIDLMENDTGQSFEILNEPVGVIKETGEENIVQFLFEPLGKQLLIKNLTNIVLSDEYSALLMYSFPTKDLLDMFIVFNIAIVSADTNVKNAFFDTKNAVKTLFNSIYGMVGPAKYKKLKGPYA